MTAIKAIIHKADEGGYWAEIPDMPGCFTQGETLDEVKAHVLEAAQCWLEGQLADLIDFQVPHPRHSRRKAEAVLA